jgi:hypothetical protein
MPRASPATGGQFVTPVKALPGNPSDGHTLATAIPDMAALIGNTIARILADRRAEATPSFGRPCPAITSSIKRLTE